MIYIVEQHLCFVLGWGFSMEPLLAWSLLNSSGCPETPIFLPRPLKWWDYRCDLSRITPISPFEGDTFTIFPDLLAFWKPKLEFSYWMFCNIGWGVDDNHRQKCEWCEGNAHIFSIAFRGVAGRIYQQTWTNVADEGWGHNVCGHTSSCSPFLPTSLVPASLAPLSLFSGFELLGSFQKRAFKGLKMSLMLQQPCLTPDKFPFIVLNSGKQGYLVRGRAELYLTQYKQESKSTTDQQLEACQQCHGSVGWRIGSRRDFKRMKIETGIH